MMETVADGFVDLGVPMAKYDYERFDDGAGLGQIEQTVPLCRLDRNPTQRLVALIQRSR